VINPIYPNTGIFNYAKIVFGFSGSGAHWQVRLGPLTQAALVAAVRP
jgi:hypothetical protein